MGDDELWEKMGKGLANLKSLNTSTSISMKRFFEETNAVEHFSD
jgi:hypothetical protein